ncbi:AMIN domain-containing protein, partial [Pseudomonas gingeri]
MNRIISAFGISLWMALVSPMVLAANLKTLDVAALPGDRVELRLAFDSAPAAPHGYTTDQPARIALDLAGVTSQLATRTRDLGVGNARSVTVVEAKDRTRLIINLTKLVPYSTRIEGNNLFVVVGQGAVAAVPGQASAARPVA